MIKAKDFLHHLCNVLGYRSFTGYPDEGFISLYSNMDSGFMHYIPTVRTDIAFNLALGTSIGGIKSIVIAGSSAFIENYGLLESTVLKHEVPILILIYNNSDVTRLPIKTFKLTDSYDKVLNKADKFIMKNKKQCAILINEGDLV